ncbi:MAG: hypothetical protein CSA62_06365 [Planctomycetota bacterium]|nr:MAG: hypothetical protein CSA62_06365 [Planctomycetota bacterium]
MILIAALLAPVPLATARAAMAAPLPLQAAKKIKDDPEVDKLLKQLKGAMRDRRGTLDAQGSSALTALIGKFDKLNQKQQRKIVKDTSLVFRATRKPAQAMLFLAAAEALSRFGDKGAEALMKQADNGKFKGKEWRQLRKALILLLGRPALPKHAKFLIDIAVQDPDELARAAAGEALGSYAKYDQKLRKEIVKKLAIELNAIFNMKNSGQLGDRAPQEAAQTFTAIQGPWMNTLSKLTGQRQKDPMLWLRWWNNNKRKNWDKLGYGGSKKGVSRNKK